ncbi:hypothetical protein [Pseudoalteromonas maricaloris]|uniref:hypothetical protein n=1 Tax=Pseudoalteromonas maricaloris TaxID=184924 RepID=UPI0021AD7D1E|nr:hypothetical protein [Pseudoalteromonas flavipulchra]
MNSTQLALKLAARKALIIRSSGYDSDFKYGKCERVLGPVDLSSLFLQQFDWYLYKAEPA